MKPLSHRRTIRYAFFTIMLIASVAAAAGMDAAARMHPYQSPLERNRITLDAQRMPGSPDSRVLSQPRRMSSPAPRPLQLAPGRDHGAVDTHTPRWEMLDFCPDRGFSPDVRDCPAGWRRVQVDVGP